MCRIFVITVVAVLALDHGLAQYQNPETFANFNARNMAVGPYSFQLSPDQIVRQEFGNFGNNGNYMVQGSYSYINDLNKRVSVTYTAHINVNQAFPDPSPGTGGIGGGAGYPPQIIAACLGR